MKQFAFFLAAALGLSVAANAQATDLTFKFGNPLSGGLVFGSDSTFHFANAGLPNNFVGNFAADAGTTLFGDITGTFKVGSVSGAPGGAQSATVTGLGGNQFIINDGTGGSFSANLDWLTISTPGNSTSTVLNGQGTVNLTSPHYTSGGSPNALLTLLGVNTDASVTINFTFNPAVDLSALVASGGNTNYSGTLTTAPEPSPPPAPEPASLALVGVGLLGMAGSYGWRRWRTPVC